MSVVLYDIVDKTGDIMPRYYSGRGRTFDEATKMCEGLNKNGEYRPYHIEPIGYQPSLLEKIAPIIQNMLMAEEIRKQIRRGRTT